MEYERENGPRIAWKQDGKGEEKSVGDDAYSSTSEGGDIDGVNESSEGEESSDSGGDDDPGPSDAHGASQGRQGGKVGVYAQIQRSGGEGAGGSGDFQRPEGAVGLVMHSELVRVFGLCPPSICMTHYYIPRPRLSLTRH